MDYERGSGDVSQDLVLPNAEERLVKAQLVFKINNRTKAQRMKQIDATARFLMRQPYVSRMLRGDFRQFSVERLIRFLVALDRDAMIVVRPLGDREQPAILLVT